MLGEGFVRQVRRRGARLFLLLAASWAMVGSGGATGAVPHGSQLSYAASGFNYCARQAAVFSYRRPFMGISDVAVQVSNGNPDGVYRDCSMGQMVAAGIGYFREFIDWRSVEASPNVYNFSTLDSFEIAAAKHHMRVLATVFGAPSWRSTAPAKGAKRGFYPPSNPQDFAYFTSLLVQRYGPNGTFWRENPNVPYEPTRAWQVWNEPDLTQSWEPRPNLAAYVRLLKATSVAIKRNDPGATVVSAGMPFYTPQDENRNLSQLYRFGARPYFGALAIHPYSSNVQEVAQWLWGARRVMDRFGDRDKPLWVTEVGWSGGDPDLFLTNPRKQRSSVTSLFRLVQRLRGRVGLQVLMWYQWQDRFWTTGPRNWWGFHEGFFTTGLRPKPSFAALQAAAPRLDR
jgi:hypothetical protein